MQRSINPFDQSVLAEFPVLGENEIKQKINSASGAYRSWKNTSFSERSSLLKKVAAQLRAKENNYAKIISLEMGKVFKEALAEVRKCADGCDYYADNTEQFLADETIQTEAKKSYITYQPTGVILAVMPWNFPLWQVFRFAAPALMAGNTALLKHSSNVPQCSLFIEEAFTNAGAPDGIFHSLLISNDAVENIIADDAVQGIALTGSEKAGGMVASIAGKHIKKTVLELGGSDAFIVLKDADLQKTVKVATTSRMQNAGQSCIAAKRFIVAKEISKDFVELFKTEIEKLKQGNQLDESVTTGPMARVDLADELEDQQKRTLAAGARLVTGGKRSGANYQPTLIDNVTPGMAAFDEETFGPLAAVTIAKDEVEAIRLADNSRFGLGGSVWTSDLEKGEWMARQIETGTVYVNSLMRSDARLPFGGIKKSGYGRELSFPGIREFVNAKTISVNTF